jgi:hypothetical protein
MNLRPSSHLTSQMNEGQINLCPGVECGQMDAGIYASHYSKKIRLNVFFLKDKILDVINDVYILQSYKISIWNYLYSRLNFGPIFFL